MDLISEFWSLLFHQKWRRWRRLRRWRRRKLTTGGCWADITDLTFHCLTFSPPDICTAVERSISVSADFTTNHRQEFPTWRLQLSMEGGADSFSSTIFLKIKWVELEINIGLCLKGEIQRRKIKCGKLFPFFLLSLLGLKIWLYNYVFRTLNKL